MKLDFKKPLSQLKQDVKKIQAYDLSVIYPSLSSEEKNILRSAIDYKKIVLLFEKLETPDKKELFEMLPTVDRKKRLLDSIKLDELKDFIAEYKKDEQDEIISLLKEIKQVEIKKMLIYSDNLASSLMTPEIIKISEATNVKNATQHLIENSKDNDYIDDIYVVKDDDTLVGVIKLKDLIVARQADNLTDLIDYDYNYIYNDKPIFEVVDIFKDYDEKAIPVVDYNKKILGVITSDDIIEEVYEKQKEDFQRLAFLSEYNKNDSAIKRSLRRLPWLLISIILGLLIANFLMIFERTIQAVAVIFLFQSLILDTAGNIGTQSLAVTILLIAQNKLDKKSDVKAHLKKEIAIALINSFIIGVYGFIIAFGFLNIPINIIEGASKSSISSLSQSTFSISIGIIVFLSLFISMFVSAILGVLIPIVAKKRKINPANVSGPILTTSNDLLALLVYFSIATIFIKIFK